MHEPPSAETFSARELGQAKPPETLGYEEAREWLLVQLQLAKQDNYNDDLRHLADWILPPYSPFGPELRRFTVKIWANNRCIQVLPETHFGQQIPSYVLEVRDLGKLVTAFIEYHNYYKRQTNFYQTLYGVTVNDMKRPEVYWQQLTDCIRAREETVDKTQRQISLDQVWLSARSRITQSFLFPYPMEQAGHIASFEDDISTPLPVVNWRYHHANGQGVATISQIQTPNKIPVSMEAVRKSEAKTLDHFNTVKQFIRQNPNVYQYLWPQLKEVAIPSDTESIADWMHIIQIMVSQPYLNIPGTSLDKVKAGFLADLGMTDAKARVVIRLLVNAVGAASTVEASFHAQESKRMLKESQQQMFNQLSRELKAASSSEVLKHVKQEGSGNFPSAKYAALVLFISKVAKLNCKTLRIPTYLPYQEHEDSAVVPGNEIDSRIMRQLLLCAERAVLEIEGVCWLVEPTADDYAVLQISPELRSSNTVVQKLLQAY